jgi:hypothetical protein
MHEQDELLQQARAAAAAEAGKLRSRLPRVRRSHAMARARSGHAARAAGGVGVAEAAHGLGRRALEVQPQRRAGISGAAEGRMRRGLLNETEELALEFWPGGRSVAGLDSASRYSRLVMLRELGTGARWPAPANPISPGYGGDDLHGAAALAASLMSHVIVPGTDPLAGRAYMTQWVTLRDHVGSALYLQTAASPTWRRIQVRHATAQAADVAVAAERLGGGQPDKQRSGRQRVVSVPIEAISDPRQWFEDATRRALATSQDGH